MPRLAGTHDRLLIRLIAGIAGLGLLTAGLVLVTNAAASFS
jgi:hypothetical protein